MVGVPGRLCWVYNGRYTRVGMGREAWWVYTRVGMVGGRHEARTTLRLWEK